MDAQNAAGPDETKPAAAACEPKRPDHAPSETRAPASTAPVRSPIDDSRPPPALDRDVKPSARSSVESADDKSGHDAASSDAETIVLPGKDGHSPSKVRKVKHEDKSDNESPSPSAARTSRDKEEREHEHTAAGNQDDAKGQDKYGIGKEKGKGKDRERSPTTAVTGPTDSALSQPIKKKRLLEKSEKPSLPPPMQQNNKDPSVSTATSPPPKSRKSTDANPSTLSDSNSDTARHKPTKDPKDRLKSAEKLVPHKRKAPRLDSEDEDENRKARRQRTAPASTNPDSHPSKRAGSHHDSDLKSEGHTRSVSPQGRTHRRSVSTSNQLSSQSSSGLSQKKKRVPAPLQSTEYHSDESSAGGSPHPRSSKLRNLSTPAMADSNVSPAKVAPHKKHLDAHGQTFLARACARGEYDQAKQRLGERPEDLNVADYAGNTPLQIAAINGCEDIVELLINAGCNLECVNYDKDTPLLDAVDNGHLGVVKLLLDAGVNPRKANVHGEEPLDRVNDEFDNAEEIRALLGKARQRMGDRRRTSEERNPDNRASTGPESPRRSPAGGSSLNAQSSSSRRAGTVRATKTSNHLLYMPMDDKTLRIAAGRGDEETVTRILQVRDGCDDSEAMVNAARGGHDVVMQLLLALGGANPDPPPVPHMPAEVATPMLAAIGQENIKVIQLLLDQGNFDPTRRFKGETYFEIAHRRQGTNWKEEEHALSKAYEEHRKSRSKDLSKNKSPSRRERERGKEEREQKRSNRTEGRDDAARAVKRSATSPVRAGEPRKKALSKPSSSPKEKRRSHDDNQSSPKRGPGRPKNDDKLPPINVSDRENSPAIHKVKVKRAESELAAASSEGENAKPRRKLVSKAELRGEREKKQRRPSQVSSVSSLKDPASPNDSRIDDHPEKEKLKGEKYHDRTKALKRDESRDRLTVSGESTKRHRSSATPPHSNNGDKDDSEVPTKKRRLDAEGKDRRSKEDRPAKPTMSREQSLAKSMKAAKLSQKAAREDDDRRESKIKRSSDPNRRESAKSISSDKSIHVKCEDTDVDMRDAPPASQRDEAESKAKQLQEDQDKKRAAERAEATAKEERKRRELEEKERDKKKREEEEAKRIEEAKRKEEEEKKRREEEERVRREEEELKQREEAERQHKAEEERLKKEEEDRKRREEEERVRREEERKQREEAERRRKEEEERLRKEEEERKRKEEEERRRKEEEERKQKEAEEKRKREEEEKKKREEEERLRREQAEREAAEAARRKREEEERREREYRERQRAREAEIRRQREEQERIRLAKLPALLRWLETCPNPKTTQLAEKFTHMQGVRYDTIRPDANGTADGREQWVLNTQVALILGEKDLSLSRYTAWERIPVSDLAKASIWRLESDRYALTLPSTFDLGMQLPGYYGEGVDPNKMSTDVMLRLRSEAWDRFLHTDMFFVKLSDLLFIVPTMPHLRNLRLSVEYREIAESEAQLYSWKASSKWKSDPGADRFHGFAPRHKYYVNGSLVGEEMPKWSKTSRTPFPEKRVPRRNGLTRVYPDEEDYAEICKKQGLEELLEVNGAGVNGRVNGTPAAEPQARREPVNGLNGGARDE